MRDQRRAVPPSVACITAAQPQSLASLIHENSEGFCASAHPKCKGADYCQDRKAMREQAVAVPALTDSHAPPMGKFH